MYTWDRGEIDEISEKPKFSHQLRKLMGFRQCARCFIMRDVPDGECIDYIDLDAEERCRKAKKLEDKEKKRLATIEWLKNNPKT